MKKSDISTYIAVLLLFAPYIIPALKPSMITDLLMINSLSGNYVLFASTLSLAIVILYLCYKAIYVPDRQKRRLIATIWSIMIWTVDAAGMVLATVFALTLAHPESTSSYEGLLLSGFIIMFTSLAIGIDTTLYTGKKTETLVEGVLRTQSEYQLTIIVMGMCMLAASVTYYFLNNGLLELAICMGVFSFLNMLFYWFIRPNLLSRILR